jgi:hypothetical protein
VRVASEAEKRVALLLAEELSVTDIDDISVDPAVVPSSTFLFTPSVVAAVHADQSGQLAVKLALLVL